MKIPIVNEHDEIIGHKERGTLLPEDICRASGLWVVNNNGDILLIKRSEKVMYAPGVWSVLTGTVDEGETYLSNVIKEAAEEIGLKLDGKALEILEKVLYSSKDNSYKNRYFVQWYKVVSGTDISNLSLDTNEISEVRWFKRDALESFYESEPEKFVAHFDKGFEVFKNIINVA